MADSTVRGRFVWHELMTTDPKSAAAFFSKVIGWKAKPWGEDASYNIFMAGDRQVAGLMAVPEEARKMGVTPRWFTYIGTPNVDDTARLAVSLGAKIQKGPEDIPTVGRFAVVQDPQGASFCIYTPKQSQQTGEPAAPDFSWHELATTDAPAAFAFYQRLFGWEETSAMDMGPDLGLYHMFGRTKDGPPLGGMFNKPKQLPGPPAWLPYIKVADAQSTAAMVLKRGGKVINGPMEVPGGDWIAQGLDLQSAMFAVHSLKAPVTQAAAPAAPQKKTVASRAPKKKAASKKAASKKAAPAKKKSAAAKKRSTTKKGAAKKSKAKAKAKPAKKTMKKRRR